MSRNRLIWAAATVVVVAVLGLWVKSRWNAWFSMPAEPKFEVSKKPHNVQLTVGIDMAKERVVTWQSGVATECARLEVVGGDGDTVRIGADRHDFRNEAGAVSYYSTGFEVDSGEYCYRVCVDTMFSEWNRMEVRPWLGYDTLRFVVMGDVQNVWDSLNYVIRRIQREFRPELWLQAGDLTERPHMQWWKRYFEDFDSVAQSVPMVAALGNHDFHKTLPRRADERFFYTFPFYEECEGSPEGTAHFDVGNASIYVLNSTRNVFALMSQRRWFERECASGDDGRWRIVMLHHPPFSSKSRFNNLPVKWVFVPTFNKAGVDVVFSAHEHTCGRLNPGRGRGFYQYISHFSPKNYTGDAGDGRHFHVVDVAEGFIEVKTYTDMFEMSDSVRIEK